MAIPITLRKSTDCTFYLQGSCKKGDTECEFRHNPLALNPAVKDCAFWFNGRCAKGPACPFRHLAQNYGAYGMPRAQTVDPSTVPCVFYAQGKCMKGDACPYSHSLTLAASAANSVDIAGGAVAEEGELQGGQVPAEAGAADIGRRKLSWRAQAQAAAEPSPGQENMVLQFDEEDEEADAAAPGSDRRKSTPSKARRGPIWDIRTSVGRAGETVRSVARSEPAVRQIVREHRPENRGESRGENRGNFRETHMEDRLGRRRVGGGREEMGDRGAPRRVVATTSPSVKDRLGGDGLHTGANQGSHLRVQARVDAQDSQRERLVVDLQRASLAKGADRWGRNRNQGEQPVVHRPEVARPARPVEAPVEEENGGPRKFGAEARRRWLEQQKEKGVPGETKGSGGDGAPERSGEGARMRELVELDGSSRRIQATTGSVRGPEASEKVAEKKDGPRILTLAEIRAAKKRAREIEEAGRAEPDSAAREGKRPAPVKLNRAGLVASPREAGNLGEANAEEVHESTRDEAAEGGGDDIEGEDANGGEDKEANMDADAEEGDYADAGGEEDGSEYEEEEGDEGDDGEDDIASLMKKYGDAAED